MRSDRVILPGHLCKLQCAVCGLVRSGGQDFGDDVSSYYADAYDSGASDHLFYTASGPIPRSVVFADWIAGSTDADVWVGAPAVVEIGSGAGYLLREMAGRFPRASFTAVEPGRRAADRLSATGVDAVADIDDVPDKSRDVIVAVAVLEHVVSPTVFLATIRKRLTDRGTLILAQPTQDVQSYDVLFADHLHHFASAHLEHYARKCGFREVRRIVGHPLMPNFSLHVWRAAESLEHGWEEPPASSLSAASAAAVMADMARLNAWLEQSTGESRRIAAFGVHEVFAVTRAYSDLGNFPIVCGLDDEPDRRGEHPFPIVRPEQAHDLGVTDAVLTMNAVHYPVASRRLEQLGIRPHPVLTS